LADWLTLGAHGNTATDCPNAIIPLTGFTQ
jgi:hypothetical protein